MFDFIKRHKILILLLILVYVFYYFAYYRPHHTIKQYVTGVQSSLSLSEEPDDGHAPILDAINGAKQSIHVEVYLLSDKQIIDSLVSKRKEGLDVKVMLEEHPFGGGNVNNKSKKTLESAGIPVQWTNPSFALTHEKAIIIDGTKAFILNQNLTASSFSKNREYDILDENQTDATEIEKIFETDWSRSGYSPEDPNLLVSPIDSRAKLEALLNNSKSEIDVEMEVIEDREILSDLEQKAKTEKVMVIIPDFKKVSANEKSARALEDSGVDVRTISNPYIHAKLVITDDNKAYVGSVNFTTASMDENRELGIIFSQTDIIQKLTASFDSDWQSAVDYK